MVTNIKIYKINIFVWLLVIYIASKFDNWTLWIRIADVTSCLLHLHYRASVVGQGKQAVLNAIQPAYNRLKTFLEQVGKGPGLGLG